MVDALQSAWEVLRPRGHLVNLRPVVSYRPTIRLRRGRRALAVGPVIRELDEDVAAAARAARAAVREGLFDVSFAIAPRWRASYPGLAELQRTIDASENWRLPATTRRRIASLWREGDTLDVTRPFSLTVLRKRASGRRRAFTR